MARKIRSDSVHTLTTMAGAKPPSPPKHVYLREADIPFWDSIVRAREYSTWHAADLEVAAQLARCKADIERLQKQLDSESDTIENSAGNAAPNPLHALIEMLSRRAVTLSRVLLVNSTNTVQGEPKTRQQRSTLQRQLAEQFETPDDDLLARRDH